MKNNTLYWPVYFSWTRIRGGKRFHIPVAGMALAVLTSELVPVWFMPLFLLSSLYVTKVGNTTYVVAGLLFIECKIYFGPPPALPEITDEEVLRRNTAKLIKLMGKNKNLSLKDLSKKLKVSTNSVKQLCLSEGYIVEENEVFLK